MITLNLTPDQVGLATIALSTAQLAAIHAQEDAPVVTPPSTGGVSPFVPPPAVAHRALMKTDVKWQNGPSFYSSAALTDANAWCMGFTPTDDRKGGLSTAEYQGPFEARNWALVRNRDGVVIAQGVRPTQTPSIQFNGTSSPIAPRIPLTVGERYTFTVWNATPAQSSRMVGQLYL